MFYTIIKFYKKKNLLYQTPDKNVISIKLKSLTNIIFLLRYNKKSIEIWVKFVFLIWK